MDADLRALLSRRVHWDDAMLGEPQRVNEFREWGDLPFHVSIFDHSLTGEEAAASPIMFYRLAHERGAMREYLAGEARFEAFYAELSRDGAWIDLQGRRPRWLPGSSQRLVRTIRDSLRERRLMHLTFPALPVRVYGGYDRTDLMLPASKAIGKALQAMAVRHGLFVLPYTPPGG